MEQLPPPDHNKRQRARVASAMAPFFVFGSVAGGYCTAAAVEYFEHANPWGIAYGQGSLVGTMLAVVSWEIIVQQLQGEDAQK